MASNNNSNRKLVPEAQEALDKFKMEAASEVGVNLKNGYNGDLTSREAGSVGGQIGKKSTIERTASFEWIDRNTVGQSLIASYATRLAF